MMPTGSSARTSSSCAVHGSTAEKTCCSRTRRAMSCVYWPPKSSTTMPCLVLETRLVLSFCDAAPVDGVIWLILLCSVSSRCVVRVRLLYDDVDEFVGDDDGFYDLLAGDF